MIIFAFCCPRYSPILIPHFHTNVEGDVPYYSVHKKITCIAFFISYLYIPFIHNLFAEMYELIQGRGDYNAKFGVTILGMFLIYLIPTSVLKYKNILKKISRLFYRIFFNF